MAQAATIDLLRHGQTERDNIFRGSTDDPLHELGWRQMQAACGDDRWHRIVSSPLSRCRHFAEALAAQHGSEFEVDDRLSEYHFGDWDGKTYDEVLSDHREEVGRFFADPVSVTPPNGEPFVDFRIRVAEAWRALVDTAKVDASNTLVVSHGGVILTVLAQVMGVEDLHRKIAMPFASRSRVQVALPSGSQTLLYHK